MHKRSPHVPPACTHMGISTPASLQSSAFRENKVQEVLWGPVMGEEGGGGTAVMHGEV